MKIKIGDKFCASYIEKLMADEVYITQAKEEIILTFDEAKTLIKELQIMIGNKWKLNESQLKNGRCYYLI